MDDLETQILALKRIVGDNDGSNVADLAFVRQVDDLISRFYDDIGEIRQIDLKSLFDLFLLKTLYVERRSRDARALDYLSAMMMRFLWARELFPLGASVDQFRDLMAVLWDETRDAAKLPNLFEAYRKVADTALFVVGIFPRSLGRRWRWGSRRSLAVTPSIPRDYYTELGRRYYRLAAEHDLAEWTGQRPVLERLSAGFDIYVAALNEMSERYILGFDMNVIADKLLDSLNRYRRSGDERHLDNARKYAALLRVDSASFRRFYRRRRPGYVIL